MNTIAMGKRTLQGNSGNLDWEHRPLDSLIDGSFLCNRKILSFQQLHEQVLRQL